LPRQDLPNGMKLLKTPWITGISCDLYAFPADLPPIYHLFRRAGLAGFDPEKHVLIAKAGSSPCRVLPFVSIRSKKTAITCTTEETMTAKKRG